MFRQYNFLMYSPKRDAAAAKITTEVMRNKLYAIQTVSTPQGLRNSIRDTTFQCLILNVESFSGMRSSDVFGSENVTPCPIIVFAERVALEAYQNKDKKIVIIEKPFEAKDIWGICGKLLQGEHVKQRVFRRYDTNQLAFIKKTLTGEQCRGQVVNLSRGGANVEIVSGNVSPGEVLKMNIRGSEQSISSYDVDAEVIWAHPPTGDSQPATAGVRFMQKGDFYRSLLQRL